MAGIDPKRTFAYQEKVLIMNPTPPPPENLLPIPLPGINLREREMRGVSIFDRHAGETCYEVFKMVIFYLSQLVDCLSVGSCVGCPDL